MLISVNKIKIIYIYIAIIVLFIGCKKDKPPVGFYVGSFIGKYTDTTNTIINRNRYEELYIVKTNKSSIEMATCPNCNRFYLSKEKKNKVSGIIDICSVSGGNIGYIDEAITINGKWEKQDGVYYIKGYFNYNYIIVNTDSLIQQTYVVTGDFEIKSN